jgi:lysophospholipase L1-like esterase
MTIKLTDYRIAAVVSVAALAAIGATLPPRAKAGVDCSAPAELVKFDRPLGHIAGPLASDRPVSIVTYGSSSTAGAGASSPGASYPSRLEAELKERFFRNSIKVTNRGVGGTEMPDMIARMVETLPLDKPDLVIWQLGTNSLLRDREITPKTSDRINEGLSKIRSTGADVILINPQYAPRVIAKAEALHMVKVIASTADRANVNVYDRFAIMRYWRLGQNQPFDQFLSQDGLHMNDWSYGCTAKLLANAIKEAATRPAQTATAPAVSAR